MTTNHDLSVRALARLEELTRLESPSGDREHLNVLRDNLVGRWSALGLEVTVVSGVAGDHVVADWMVPGDQGHVLLITHYDTVWPVGELLRQPFAHDGDVVSGPGTLDMKAGIVAIELALEGLRERGETPTTSLRIVCVADEELSSLDGRRVVEQAAQGATSVLGFEAAHPDGAFKNGRRGVARLLITVTGRAAHAGLAADAGVSAIDELVDLLNDIRVHAPVATDGAVNVGRIRGGSRANVVAAEAEAEIGVRFADPATERALLSYVQGLSPRRNGATVTVTVLSQRPAWPADPDSWLTSLVERIASDLGGVGEARPTGGAGDANFTGAAGIPTLDGLGPRGDHAHALGEYFLLSSLLERIELLERLLVNPELRRGH